MFQSAWNDTLIKWEHTTKCTIEIIVVITSFVTLTWKSAKKFNWDCNEFQDIFLYTSVCLHVLFYIANIYLFSYTYTHVGLLSKIHLTSLLSVKQEINWTDWLTYWPREYQGDFAMGLVLDNQFFDNCKTKNLNKFNRLNIIQQEMLGLCPCRFSIQWYMCIETIKLRTHNIC